MQEGPAVKEGDRRHLPRGATPATCLHHIPDPRDTRYPEAVA